MEKEFDFSSAAIYMLKSVRVQFKDATYRTGTLMPNDESSITLEGATYGYDSIADIEYIATIDDFYAHKESENPRIGNERWGKIGKIQFSVSDLHPDFCLSDLLYGEYSCEVSCHLHQNGKEIYASDIRLIEKRHKINDGCATVSNLMYKYGDGSIVTGFLTGRTPNYFLRQMDGSSLPLDVERIVDITKAPEENDYIYVILNYDSDEHCGLVSAINGTVVVLMKDSEPPEFLDLVNAATIRYRGVIHKKKAQVNGKITPKSMIAADTSNGDTGYICKKAWFRNPKKIDLLEDGDEVVFTAGINGEYLIAKDVDLILKIPQETEHETITEPEHYGIILTVDLSKKNGFGYIGNRFVSKSCGEPAPGNVRFRGNQLDFNLERGKRAVVKYTVTGDTKNGLKVVSQLSFVEFLDETRYGIIEVSDDGSINAIPLYRAGISFFEKRDVDVYCINSTVLSGSLQRYNELEICILKGQEGSGEEVSIPFSEINDIRLIGTVSQYYQNGTGYVDNLFFFHINEMEKATDAQYIRRGVQVSFSLRNSQKGNYVDCRNIRIIHEKRVDVYVLGYQNKSYTVIDSGKYGKGIDFTDNTYEIPYSMYNQFRDLENEDYHAILTIQRKNGVDECTAIRTLDGCPKLCYGIVTALDHENGTVSITTPSYYRKKPHSSTYALSPQGESGRISKPDAHDYPVLYYTQAKNGTIVVTITWVDLRNIYDKCHFGYLEQYSDEKKYGWIVDDKFLGTPWKKENRVYCSPSSFVDPPEVSEFLVFSNWFRVCYVLDLNSEITKYNPQPPAKQVWFLGKKKRSAKESYASKATKEIHAGKTTEVSPSDANLVRFVTHDIVLNEEFPIADTENLQWRYGIIVVYSATFGELRLFSRYYNKAKTSVPEDVDSYPPFIINQPVSDINITYGDISKIKTTKNGSIYLVRYPVTTVDEQEVYDNRYPIVLLREYRKSTVKSLVIDSGILHTEIIPSAPYVPGETIMVLAADQNYVSGGFSSIDGDTIRFDDGRTISAPESSIIRFGVLTSFDDNMTVGYINGKSPFLFANTESKTFNMIKSAKRKMLLCYSCNNGTIDYVERISLDYREKMPMQWKYGRVTDYTVSMNERSVCVNDDVTCLLSTDIGGGYIQNLINSENIVDTAVFIKTVICPIFHNDEPLLKVFAYDVHCEQERSHIHYDPVEDRYLAARNSARPECIEGNRDTLSSLLDSETEVLYRVTNDGRNLQAYIDTGEDSSEWNSDVVEEEEIAASQALFSSSLVGFLIAKVDLRSIYAPENIILREDGWPDNEQAVSLAKYYLGKRSPNLDESIAVIALLKRLPETVCEEILRNVGVKSIEAILWKTLTRQVGIIGQSANCVWGEYSYYQNTILSDIHSLERQKEELYKFFMQDFYSRIEVMDQLRKFRNRGRKRSRFDLKTLFQRNLIEDTVGQLVAHIVSLDKSAVECLIITENVLEGNDIIADQIVKWGKNFDQTLESDSPAAVIDHLRSIYQSDKIRFLRDLESASQSPNIITATENILQIIHGRFIYLIGEDDSQRFSTLQSLCKEIINTKQAGFTKYRKALLEAWTKINTLLKDSKQHPTKETTEMLIRTQILSNIQKEIASSLNDLLSRKEYFPDIHCESSGSEIIVGQKNLMLLVSNGVSGNTNRQSAFNVKIMLEVLGGLSNDSVPSEISLPEKELVAGNPETVLDNIPLILDSLEGDAFSIAVSVQYNCCTGFTNSEIIETQVTDCGIMEFQIQDAESREQKKKDAINYYLRPSEGNPLKETDSEDSNMFFGREAEKAEIWNAIVDENNHLRGGRAVMLYGQKKTGKTSLANQILGKIRQIEKVNEQAIIIRIPDIMEIAGGITELNCFTINFYQYILDSFELALCEHPDVEILLDENDLTIPDLTQSPMTVAALFQRFFRKFSLIDHGHHRIVLIIDEFTRLCTTLIDRPEYHQIPNFIKLFSGMGFIQIIIGHPNMMRALSKLGIINHTAEFSKRIELSGLKREDAIALIREPMKRSFGYDVYSSKLGTHAIDMLLDLSGCHPSVLMKLCNEMFKHFISTDYSQIILRDVNKMLVRYLDELDPPTTFDIMVIEDGDTAEFFDNLPTYRYLKSVALQSLNYNNQDCDFDFVVDGLSLEENSTIRDTLLMRKVLTANNGRISILIKLFIEYVRHKYKNL